MYPHRTAGVAATSVLTLLTTVLAPAVSAKAQDRQRVPLGYGVPKDVHFYVHGLTSKNRDPGLRKLDKAIGRLVESRIHEDILDLATIDLSPERRREARAVFDHVLGLFDLVDWGLLVEREVVFAYRLAMPLPEYLVMFRVPEDRVGTQVDGMKKLLAEFAKLVGVPETSVRDVELRAGKMTVFEVEHVPVQISAGAVGDVFVLSTSSRMGASVMKKLAKGDAKGSLVGSDRFRTSLEHLPKATEDTLFVDIGGVLGFLKQVMQLGKAGAAGARDPEAADMVAMLRAILDELDVCDHLMNTTVSDGTTVTSTALVKMRPDFDSSSLATLFTGQKPWSGWTRFVPADATEFYFDTGMNPAAFCDLGIQLLKENLRDPEIPTKVLTDLRDDLLANISGESAYVALSRVGPEGCALGDCVTFLRLDKSEGVLDRVKGWLEGLARHLSTRGQKMAVVTAEGVHEVRLEAFPWIRPAIAVREDCLVVATSSAALAKVDRVRAGEERSIRSRQEFATLGIGKADSTEYLAYGRIDSSMNGFANLVSAAGFFLSLLPEERDTRAAIKLGAILTKLAPALRELRIKFDWGTELLPSTTPDVIMSRTVYHHHR